MENWANRKTLILGRADMVGLLTPAEYNACVEQAYKMHGEGRFFMEPKGHIVLDKEGCGAIYKAILTDNYDIARLDPLVVGTTTDGKKRCDDAGIAHPDNILGLANGWLLLAEDAGKRAHPVDMLWLKK